MNPSGSDAIGGKVAPTLPGALTLQVGEVVAGKYRVEQLLGSGGMAEVYAAVNLLTEKRVALKLILATLSKTHEIPTRLRREALAAGRIHHPNVVTMFDAVEHQGSTCLVMELLEGETLAERLARNRQPSLVEVVALILPAMRGVAAAHAQGVVHRDLKPDNIFIQVDATGLARGCKVLDFGVSKLSAGAVEPELAITLAGNLVGTPMYMAPEQVRGLQAVDHRMDIYSLGVVLYEMIAGRVPFVEEVYSALMVQIATTDPPPLSRFRAGVPKRITEVVSRALERNVERRFQDMESFIRSLEEAARDELHVTIGTPPQGLVTELSAPRPASFAPTESVRAARLARWSKLVFIGVGLALGLTGLVLWQWVQAGAPPSAINSESRPGAPTTGTSPQPPRNASAPLPPGTAPPRPPGAPLVVPSAASSRSAQPPQSPSWPGPDDGTSRLELARRVSLPARAGHVRPEPPDLPLTDLPPPSDSPEARSSSSSPPPRSSPPRPLRAGRLTVDDF